MTRVALFGGSFNPPHVAHQLAALYVLETQAVDELWFAPAYAHPFAKPLAPFADRIAMCELVAAPLGQRVRVRRDEEQLAQRPGFVASRTLDLLDHLLASEPSLTLRLVIGSDILNETAKWYRWDEVVARAPPIVLGRAGTVLPPGSSATELVLPEVSSTEIRDLLAALPPDRHARLGQGGGSGRLGELLPASVLRYIATSKLYLAAP